MKPIAWWTGKWDDDCDFMSERIRQAHEERGSFTPRDFPIALFAADQLKAAQVAVLRKASEKIVYTLDAETNGYEAVMMLVRMANELEKQK